MYTNSGARSGYFNPYNSQLNNYMPSSHQPTHNSQLEHLISNYDSLPQIKKKEVRDTIQRHVAEKEDLFQKNIKEFFSKPRNSIVGINLIAGTTGSGKSTLFNYIHGFPLVIEQHPSRPGIAILRLDSRFTQNNPHRTCSPIGQGFVSKTSYPIIALGEGGEWMDVDLPGEFDNKDFLQSIVNALLRIRVCELAPQMKLTVVVSYHELSNRGAALRKTLAEVEKFIGSWQHLHPHALLLVVTQVPSELNDLLIHVKNRLKELTEYQAKDLGQFKVILDTIIKNQAFGIMPTPRLKFKPKTITGSKPKPKEGIQQGQLVVPAGQIYSPQKNYCSPQLLNKKIALLQYVKIYEGLICPGIKLESIQIVEDICFSLIEQLKKEYLKKMKEKVKNMNRKALEQNRQLIRYLADLGSLRKVFSIKQDFLDNQFKDLSYFLKLTKIKDVDRQLLVIKKDIELFVSQRINELDELKRKKQEEELKRLERRQERRKRLQELRSRLRQIEQQLQESQKTRVKSQKLSKEEMKELENEWFELRDEISDQQTDKQKQERNQLERFDGLRVESDDEKLPSEDLKMKKQEIQKQQQSCNKKLQTSSSKEPAIRLVLRRRIKKLNKALQKIGQIKQKKKQELASHEQAIQEASKIKRKDRQRLQEEWYQLKDYISDLQDKEQKKQRQSQYEQFDEDLHQSDEHKLKHQKLKEKILRMRQKRSHLKTIKDSIQGEQSERLQFLKINRRMRKLLKKIELCKQIQKEMHNHEAQEDSDDS